MMAKLNYREIIKMKTKDITLRFVNPTPENKTMIAESFGKKLLEDGFITETIDHKFGPDTVLFKFTIVYPEDHDNKYESYQIHNDEGLAIKSGYKLKGTVVNYEFQGKNYKG